MKILLRNFALVLLLTVAMLTLARRDERRWAVFESPLGIDAGSNIHLMSEDGSHARDITPIDGCGIAPEWSPDGRWIAFTDICNYSIQFLRIWPGGSTPADLTAPIPEVYRVDWSPDGQRLLIGRAPNDLYLIEAGSGEALLAEDFFEPEWSPDGEWVYARRFDEPQDSLYRIHAETGESERLFSTMNGFFDLAWSPDGSRMLVGMPTDRGREFFLANPDGSALQPLVPDLPPPRVYGPQWSPDGEWIAFLGGIQDDHAASIYRIRPDGRDLERLTDPRNLVGDLVWSPDAEWLFYSQDLLTQPALYRLRADGSSTESFNPVLGSHYPPRFAPASGAGWNPLGLALAALGIVASSKLWPRFT